MSIETALILVFMLIGPWFGTRIAHRLLTGSEKYRDKVAILKQLMALRKNVDDSMRLELSTALNTVEIIFSDCPYVLSDFHQYQQILVTTADPGKIQSAFVNMILSMSNNLGYTHLKRTNIVNCLGPKDLDWVNKIS